MSPSSSKILAPLRRASYLSLATFRRSGVAVETPVWFAEHGGRLYVFSAGDAGKVKRLRNDPRIRVAPCSVRGRVTGDWIDGHCQIVEEPATQRAAYDALTRKYGWQMRLADLGAWLTGRINHRAVLELSFEGIVDRA